MPSIASSRVVLLLASFSIATTLAGPGRAQRPPVIGYLHESTAGGAAELAFIDAMRGLGHVQDKHFTFVVRVADGDTKRLAVLAAELVALPVDLIVTGSGTPAALAAKAATSTIPIVATNMQSSIEDGLVASLARPSGNLTGTMSFGEELAAKRLQLAKEAVPSLNRIGIMWNSHNPGNGAQRRFTQDAAAALGIAVELFPMNYPEGIPETFAAAAKKGVGAMVVLSDVVSARYAKQITAAALDHRVPGIHYSRWYIDSGGGGGLLSYGPDLLDATVRAAALVDKILRGAKPGDLPVEQPSRFVLTLDLKAAKALGVAVPEAFVARADHVIE